MLDHPADSNINFPLTSLMTTTQSDKSHHNSNSYGHQSTMIQQKKRKFYKSRHKTHEYVVCVLPKKPPLIPLKGACVCPEIKKVKHTEKTKKYPKESFFLIKN